MLYQVKDLHFSYLWNKQEQPVLKGLSFSIEKSSFTCMVGPSGTGKTTLLNLLGLIDNAKSGKIIFDGEDVTSIPESLREGIRLHKVGFVFQSFYLIPTLTVLENTIYFLPSIGYSGDEAVRAGKEMLELLGLQDHLNKYPLELSGGQRQRVAIARALVKKPQVVLADEPTANLDTETAIKTIEAFQVMQKSEKVSFIFSTHDATLMSYAKQVYRMKSGLIETVTA